MSSVARWLYVVPEKKKYYVVALTIAQAIAGSLGVIYALLFRNGIDSAVKKDVKTFHKYFFLIIILVLIQISVSMIIRWLHELAAADIENTFKKRLLKKILNKDFASVSSIHTAEWLNRLTSDTKIVADGYVEILPGISETVVRLFSALVMIIFMDKNFAYILIPSGIIFVIFTCVFRRVLRQLHKNIQEQDGRLKIFLQERIGSLMIIKSFVAEGQTEHEANEKMVSHIYYKEPLCNFEMHRELFGSSHDGNFYEYYAGIKDRLIKDDGNNYGYHFSPEDFYVYLTAHEYKHYSAGGTGLRSLLDIYVFLKKFNERLDFDYIFNEVEKLEISDFEKKNRELALNLFISHELTDEDREMLKYIIYSGAYGNLENSIRNGLKKYGGGTRGKIKYLLAKIFPEREKIKMTYPFLSKYKALYPVLVVYRLMKALLKKRREVLREILILLKVKV